MLQDKHGYAYVINDSGIDLPCPFEPTDEERYELRDLEKRAHLEDICPRTGRLPLNLQERRVLAAYKQRQKDAYTPNIEATDFPFKVGDIWRLSPRKAIALANTNPARLRVLGDNEEVPFNYKEQRILTAAEIRAMELAVPEPEEAMRSPEFMVRSVKDDVISDRGIISEAEFKALLIRYTGGIQR